jgi:hypothetical protein
LSGGVLDGRLSFFDAAFLAQFLSELLRHELFAEEVGGGFV